MLQSPEGDWADCDHVRSPEHYRTVFGEEGCNPPKGIGLIATVSYRLAAERLAVGALQSPEGDWADCDEHQARVMFSMTRMERSCNPPKGIGLIATMVICLHWQSGFRRAWLQSPEGDWADCDCSSSCASSAVSADGTLQSPEGDWADCDDLTFLEEASCLLEDRCNPPKGIGLIATNFSCVNGRWELPLLVAIPRRGLG